MANSDLDPQSLAKAMAIEAAQNPDEVGDFVTSAQEGPVTDFRFVSLVPGYEGWQWSVTMFHDEELDTWTVDESTMIPTEQALLPPKWIPWKDRLKPSDLSVTDAIGTEADDERLEAGMPESEVQKAEQQAEAEADVASNAAAVQDAEQSEKSEQAEQAETNDQAEVDKHAASDQQDEASEQTATDDQTEISDQTQDESAEEAEASKNSAEDIADAVREFDLSRRRVMSERGRSETAKRWYEGPHGPKSLSTKTAEGNTCSTCGFFIPLQGELNTMFGVCANRWSPDDGRVVSLDHGCGEHSEIEPPEPSRLWIQTKPALDDYHIDIITPNPRDEHGEVELLEGLAERTVDDAEQASKDSQKSKKESQEAVEEDLKDIARTAEEAVHGAEEAEESAEELAEQQVEIVAEEAKEAVERAEEAANEAKELAAEVEETEAEAEESEATTETKTEEAEPAEQSADEDQANDQDAKEQSEN
ncbi:hypothetical protein D2E26_0779 [Bifidobacterium dolichotidis]|uniref:DUF3027 domain-containing protein n=1 Tax=Bifidobacterium dolichotidis TaxID=2306976 RepID=A0A430FPI2_9BIFI|nr:DUF3027 domain-containing protein [Bifidobacterium dolichotidis]RSX54725.1 hypothetical protein D2E26_0779 [Bifidobacterium dolichotidis]